MTHPEPVDFCGLSFSSESLNFSKIFMYVLGEERLSTKMRFAVRTCWQEVSFQSHVSPLAPPPLNIPQGKRVVWDVVHTPPFVWE